jgi:signal transduction histidine kinase
MSTPPQKAAHSPVGSPAPAALELSVLPVDTRIGISDASRQLRALARLSGSLTDPLTPSDAADIVERQALAVLDATSAVVVTLGAFPPNDGADAAVLLDAMPPRPRDAASHDRETLTLVHAIGVPAHVAAALQLLEFDAPVPLAEVARTGEPVFMNSESEMRRYPAWCDAILAAGSCAAAVVPVWANGHLRGVLGLTWVTPHAFDEDERAFVLTLGVMCAQAIMRGHLTDAGRQAREAAEYANLAKTRFLQTMSHEFRTPLNAILGYTEILSDEIVGSVTPLQQDHLRRIRRSSDHLLGLIEELLRFARLDAGEEVVSTERVIAADVVEETFDIVRAIAERKGLQLRSELPDYPIALDADRLKLRQILVNMVTNAVKYSAAGEVVLVVRAVGSGNAARINFEVTDAGRGIAVVDHERVFEAFWQVHQSLTRSSDGTGLGLAVARRLARMLGGDVVISQSELGRGTTFVAWFPAPTPDRAVGALPPA